ETATPGLHGILDLCASYRTSITATTLRYIDADPFVCVMIKWGLDGYCWKRFSSRAYHSGFRKTIESPSALPRDCPTARVFRGENQGVVEAGTTAAMWFPFIAPTSDRNEIWLEQALSLGRFGALTFLRPATCG